MIQYFIRGELSYAKLSVKKSKRFSPGRNFVEQIFTGELSRLDSAGLLRQNA